MDKKATAAVGNRSMPPCTVIPVLEYDDVEKAIDWLCHTFGFAERWRIGNHRAQLIFEGGAIVVTGRPAAAAPPSGHSLLVRVKDADAHYAHAGKQGAHILQSPADHPYGERQYTAEDPGGHRWTFSQSIADLAPEDWGGTPGKGMQ